MQEEPKKTSRSTPTRCASCNDIGLDREIVAEEICRKGVVRQYAADLGGGKDHRVRLLPLHIGAHMRLLAQVDRFAIGGENLDILARETGAAWPSRPCPL